LEFEFGHVSILYVSRVFDLYAASGKNWGAAAGFSALDRSGVQMYPRFAARAGPALRSHGRRDDARHSTDDGTANDAARTRLKQNSR
jgi:hypothetical protein